MRAGLALLVVVSAVLAGCGGKPAPPAAGHATATTGVLLGVVVDEAIRPVAGVDIAVSGPTVRNGTSDAQGRFEFDGLQPGSYFVRASHLLFGPTQTSAEVVAGVGEPPAVRLQMQHRFTQQAYSELIKFEGFVQCGYSVNPVIETQCADDYSRFVIPGGVAPQARETLDHRSYVSAIGAGWQCMVLELTWEPTAQGTSQAMFLTTSYYNRTGTDWFANVDGPNPLLARLEVGVDHPTRQGSPSRIPEQGIPDLFTFAGIHGDVAAVGVSQRFSLFQTDFYYGAPPADWSFVGGDVPPF